jgi:hypothetical protein
MENKNYSQYYAFSVEGARIGLMTCLRCGAAIVISDDGGEKVHDEWHSRIDSQLL